MSESIRYQRLKQISSRSLEESVKYLTTDRLASCYPTIASTSKGNEALKQARTQIANYWHTAATKEFDAVFEERNIYEKMLELDELIERAKSRQQKQSSANDNENGPEPQEQPVFIDKLTPDQIVDAHLRPYQQADVDQLEKELSHIRAENAKLVEEIAKDDAKINELAGVIQGSLTELDTASEASKDLPSRVEISEWVDKIST